MASRGQETPENTHPERVSPKSASSVMRFFPSADTIIESIDGFWNKKTAGKGVVTVSDSLPIRRITMSPSVCQDSKNSRSSVSRRSFSKRNTPNVRRITVANKNGSINDRKTSPSYSPLSPKQKDLVESLHADSKTKKEYIKRLSVQVETDRTRAINATKFKGFMHYSPSLKSSHELRNDRHPSESIHSYLHRAGNNTKIRKEKLRRNSMLDQHISIELSKFKEVGFMPYSPSVKMKQSHAHSAPGNTFLVKLYNYDTIWSSLKHQRLQEMKEILTEQRMEEEMKECTFQPRLSTSASNVSRHRGMNESKDDIFMTQHNYKLKMQKSLSKIKASYDDEIFRACTFKPIINKSSTEIANRKRKELTETYGEPESKSTCPTNIVQVDPSTEDLVEADKGLKRVGIVCIDDSEDDVEGEINPTSLHEGSIIVETGEDLLNRSQTSQDNEANTSFDTMPITFANILLATENVPSTGVNQEESVEVEVGEDLYSRSYVSQIENTDSNYVDVTGYCATPASVPKRKQNSSKLSVENNGFSVFEYLHNIGTKRSQDIRNENVSKHALTLNFSPTMYTNSSSTAHRNNDTFDRLYADYERQQQNKEVTRERMRLERDSFVHGGKKMDKSKEECMVRRLAGKDVEYRQLKSEHSRQESYHHYLESTTAVNFTTSKTNELLRQRVTKAIEAIFTILLETVVYSVCADNKNATQEEIDDIRTGDALDLSLANPMMLTPIPLSTHIQTVVEKIVAVTGRNIISKNRFIEFVDKYILEQTSDAKELHSLLRHTHKIYKYNRDIDCSNIHNRVLLPHEMEELKKCTFTPQLVAKQISKASYSSLSRDISTHNETTAEDIQYLMTYIKEACGNRGRSEEILLPELESAYRKLKQMVLLEDKNQLGKKLFLRFKELLETLSLSPTQFFHRFDTRGSLDYTGGDGKLSPGEVRDGINMLCDSCGKPRWRRAEYSVLTQYMDPNADGEITEEELLGAFERIEDTATAESIKRLIPIVLQLERMMISKKMRMKDLFVQIDTDKSGTVSLEELHQALTDIAPSRSELTTNRLHDRSYTIYEGIPRTLREEEEMKQCTFAPQFLSKRSYKSVLQTLSHAKETTIEDIQHLIEFIKESCGSSNGQSDILLPELESAYRKLKQLVLLEDEKTRFGHHRPSMFRLSDASPVTLEAAKRLVPIVLQLEKMMISKKMRIKDLFVSIDSDKSGSVSLEELQQALNGMLT